MPISVTCPKCLVPYRLADDMAGKKLKCQKCQAVISAPEPDAAIKVPKKNGKGTQIKGDTAIAAVDKKPAPAKNTTARTDADAFAIPGEESSKKAKAGGCSGLMIALLLGLALVVFLGCGAVGAWWFFDLGKPSSTQKHLDAARKQATDLEQRNIEQAKQIIKLQEDVEAANKKLEDQATQWAQKIQEEAARWKKTPEEETEAVEKVLLQLGLGVADVIPLLMHKNEPVKSVARRFLMARREQGADWLLLDAMASPEDDLRVACYPVAKEITGAANVPSLKFWKEAPVEERAAALEKWREAVYGHVPPVNKAVLDFTFAKYGKQVNNGECAMLVVDAVKVAKGRPVKNEGKTYVWGLALADGETAKPGDIIQLEGAKFSNGINAPHHTQIIRRVIGPGNFDILEQNSNGRRTVGSGKINLNLLVQGTAVIYRPLPMAEGKAGGPTGILKEMAVRAAKTSGQKETTDFLGELKKFFAEKESLTKEETSFAKDVCRIFEGKSAEAGALAYAELGTQLAKSADEADARTGRLLQGVGRRLPGQEIDVKGTTLDGKELDWKAYRGKVVLVDFWATFCPPCREEIPRMKEMYQAYKDQGFEIVGISVDSDRSALEKFVAKENLPWVCVHDMGVKGARSMAEHFGLEFIPLPILVGRDGKVISMQASGSELNRLLEIHIGPNRKK